MVSTVSKPEGHFERLSPNSEHWRNNVAWHMHRYRYASQFVSGKRVLDAGCGVGYGSSMLHTLGAASVVGVDISEEALGIAREKFTRPQVRFIRDDCQALTAVEGPFDVIVALESMEHFKDVRAFLRRACYLLSPEGVLVCSTPNFAIASSPGADRPDNPYHEHEYTAPEFAALLSEFFNDVSIAGQQFSASYTIALAQMNIMWSNPFMRLGRVVQRALGRRPPRRSPALLVAGTEADYVISEANVENATVFLGVCRGKRYA